MGQDGQPIALVFDKIYRARQPLRATGHFRAEAGKGLLGKFIASIIGIPVSLDYKPALLSIDPTSKHTVWRRDFGGKKFSTTFYDAGDLNVEQFAFLKIYFNLILGQSAYYESVGFSIGKFRSPGILQIISNNYPVNDHEWNFEVVIQNRKSNLVFKYWGRMKLED